MHGSAAPGVSRVRFRGERSGVDQSRPAQLPPPFAGRVAALRRGVHRGLRRAGTHCRRDRSGCQRRRQRKDRRDRRRGRGDPLRSRHHRRGQDRDARTDSRIPAAGAAAPARRVRGISRRRRVRHRLDALRGAIPRRRTHPCRAQLSRADGRAPADRLLDRPRGPLHRGRAPLGITPRTPPPPQPPSAPAHPGGRRDHRRLRSPASDGCLHAPHFLPSAALDAKFNLAARRCVRETLSVARREGDGRRGPSRSRGNPPRRERGAGRQRRSDPVPL